MAKRSARRAARQAAHRAISQASAGALADRHGTGRAYRVEPCIRLRQMKRWKEKSCFYCGGTRGLRVCHLKHIGNVYVCKDHMDSYKGDKSWEEAQ